MLQAACQTEALPLVALLALVFAVYVPTLNDYFHGDDFLAFIDLTTRPPLRHIVDTFLFQDTNVYWRPLGQVYYLAIYQVFGLDPFFFHLAGVGVFLATLALLYRFVVNFGLGRAVALTAEALAFAAMVLALLCDEVAVVLTPLPVLYMWLAQPRVPPWAVQHVRRCLAYGGLGLAVTLLQMTVGKDASNPAPVVLGLSELSIGWHIPREYWALIAKLVLPLRDGVGLAEIAPVQWVAGGVAAAAAAIVVILGTRRVWFLVAWMVLAFLPFSLWTLPIAPARYVYMAALPFAVLVAWIGVAIGGRLLATSGGTIRRTAGRLAVVAVVAVAGVLSVGGTVARNEAFARTAEPYRALAEDLPRALPSVASNTRFVIYYGVWEGAFVWQDAVVQTVYRDRTLHTLNINAAYAESDAVIPRQPNDLVLYYTERGFIVPTR